MKVQYVLATVLTTSSDVPSPQDADMRAVPSSEELVNIPEGEAAGKCRHIAMVVTYRLGSRDQRVNGRLSRHQTARVDILNTQGKERLAPEAMKPRVEYSSSYVAMS